MSLTKKLFGYKAIALICALLSPLSTPLWEGTNTGEDHCVYTSADAANWHFMGMPCRLTAEGMGTLAIGYLFTFTVLFAIMGGLFFLLRKFLPKRNTRAHLLTKTNMKSKNDSTSTGEVSRLRHVGCILFSYTFGMVAGHLAFAFFIGEHDAFDIAQALGLSFITFILGSPLLLLALLSFPLVKKKLGKNAFIYCTLACVLIPLLIGYATRDSLLLYYSFILAVPCAIFYFLCQQTKLTAGRYPRKKSYLIFGLAIAVYLLCGFLGSEWIRHRYYAEILPPGLGATKPLYKAEKYWGFGPSGNAVRLVVYALPEETALEIEQKGIAFLTSVSRSPRRGLYSWGETPMTASRPWTEYMRLPDKHDYSKETPKLEHYLDRHGYRFGINPPSEFFDMANEALLESGNFYAYPDLGGGGFVLIIPKKRRIIHAYAG